MVGLHGDALKLAVSAPPERGRANLEVTRLIASTVGVPRRDVEVRSGMTSRRKRLFIAGITVDTALARLTPRD